MAKSNEIHIFDPETFRLTRSSSRGVQLGVLYKDNMARVLFDLGLEEGLIKSVTELAEGAIKGVWEGISNFDANKDLYVSSFNSVMFIELRLSNDVEKDDEHFNLFQDTMKNLLKDMTFSFDYSW